MTESDNQFFNIDVFGSWMDVGLAVGMFVIGLAFVFKSILGLRKSKGCSPFKQQAGLRFACFIMVVHLNQAPP